MSYVIDGDYGEPFDMGPPDGEPEQPDGSDMESGLPRECHGSVCPPEESEEFPSILQSAEDARRKRMQDHDLNAYQMGQRDFAAGDYVEEWREVEGKYPAFHDAEVQRYIDGVEDAYRDAVRKDFGRESSFGKGFEQ
jgi:hypothetical protein